MKKSDMVNSMEEKTFSMSVGVRGTILGYEAAASYSVLHGESCFQGNLNINNADMTAIVALIDSKLSDELHTLLPDFLTHRSAELRFSYAYDHEMFFVDMQSFRVTAIRLKNSDGSYSGSGFLCEISEQESSGFVAELIANAKRLIGIDNFYLYISKGLQPVNIGRLLETFHNTETLLPPSRFYEKNSFCLYSEYYFSQECNGLLDLFFHELLGIENLSFFAGKGQQGAYFVLSVPQISNDIISIQELFLELDTGKADTIFQASGMFQLMAISEMSFCVDCKLSSSSLMLSASAIPKEPINLFGAFYLGNTSLTIGYNKGLTFGIVGEIYLRKLYLFAAMQFSYDGILKPQLLCFATSRLSISDLIENITGLLIPGIKALDIISIDYFDFECRNKFQMEWFEKTDLSQIAAFFNDNITASQLSIDVNTISIGRIPQDDGYALVDKYRMRHYYVDADGVLYLRPQFYYSDVAEPFTIGNGMVVSAGIFFCAKICVFQLSLKVLFSFRQQEGALAFGMLSDIDLGIIKITSSDFQQENPIPIPENSVLSQFLDTTAKGVAFYLQASQNDVSFYFDGKISIAGLTEKQAQLYYQKGLIIINLESTFWGMTTHLSLNVNYQSFQSLNFDFQFSFDTYKLEETLTKVKDRLNHAIEVCRKKINDATQSLEDAKTKVRKLYDEISYLDHQIDACRNRLRNMGWFKKIFYAPIIRCEIAGYEIAKGVLYASIYVAEAALSVAQAAVQFAGMLGEGVLQLVKGVITSVASLFFIRRLAARLSANPSELYMQLSIDFVALGKEYSHEWSVQKTLMQDSAKGREVISDNMMEKIEPDVKDLENGVVSNVYLKERYRNCVQYHDQKFDISEAAHVLERNTEMMHFVQDAYMQEFGESLPDFDEMDNRLLENIGVIESNINIAERSASLNELKETVNQLRDISENRNNRVSYEDQLKIDTAKDAVEKYEEAVKLSDEMQKLLAQITVSRRSVQMHHLERMNHSQQRMRNRGVKQERYESNMYSYAKIVKEKLEAVYGVLSDDDYINPCKDEQIWNTIVQAEDYFRVNS